MNKEEAFDILKGAFNQFIEAAPADPPAAYRDFCIKCSGTFVESGNALDGEIPDLPAAE